MKQNNFSELVFLIAIISVAFAVKPGCIELYEDCEYQGKFLFNFAYKYNV